MEVDERLLVIRGFAAPRQRRISLVAAFLGNVVPIFILAQYHLRTEDEKLLVVIVGTTMAILAPVAVIVISVRHQWLVRVPAYGGLVGLTLMQAHSNQGGGIASPYAILLVMPMLWFGLMTTGADLRAGVLLVVACCFVPTFAFPEYYGHPSEVLAPAVALAVVAVSVALSLAAMTRETSRLAARLRAAAATDQLTGLLNRRGWEEATDQALAAVPPGTPVSVVLVDLDGLKQLNDTKGHDEGDRELQETGGRLTSAFGQEAALSRLGGDEFALLLVGSTADQVQGRLAELRRSTPESGAFSAGVAMTAPQETLREAMRRADLALYEVKTTGRGRTGLADPVLTIGAADGPTPPAAGPGPVPGGSEQRSLR
jgi:diguanylate cyclase (GGDEF)-like protein